MRLHTNNGMTHTLLLYAEVPSDKFSSIKGKTSLLRLIGFSARLEQQRLSNV